MIDVKITNLNRAIKSLEVLSRSIGKKAKLLMERLAYEGLGISSQMFQIALYAGTNDVEVKEPFWDGDKLILEAVGEAVAFIEFGTGSIATPYPQLPTGDDPYTKLGMADRGEYGNGNGSNPWNFWFYPLENGLGNTGRPKQLEDGKYSPDWAWTVGNPPARAMYEATVLMSDKEHILEVAKEVFKK